MAEKEMPMTIKIDPVQYSRRVIVSEVRMRTLYGISWISPITKKVPRGGYLLYKNVQIVLGILLKIILKIRNSRFHENFYSQNCRMLPVLINCLSHFEGKINIGETSEDI